MTSRIAGATSSSAEAFPVQYRLGDSAEYRRAFADGERYADRHFVIVAVAGTDAGARLGLAISKKVARRAVDRNRIKRVVRESFRHARMALPTVDIVVLARGVTAGTSNERLFSSLEQHWRRLSSQQENSS